MDYKNLSIRILSSFIFIILYSSIFFYYTDKIIYFITLIYFLICLEVFFNFKKLTNIIIFYISISYLSIAIYIIFVFNLYEFTAIVLVIICFDSFLFWEFACFLPVISVFSSCRRT